MASYLVQLSGGYISVPTCFSLLLSCVATAYTTTQGALESILYYISNYNSPFMNTDMKEFRYENFIWRIWVILYNPGMPYIKKGKKFIYFPCLCSDFRCNHFLLSEAKQNVSIARRLQKRLPEWRHESFSKGIKVKNKVAKFETSLQELVLLL